MLLCEPEARTHRKIDFQNCPFTCAFIKMPQNTTAAKDSNNEPRSGLKDTFEC